MNLWLENNITIRDLPELGKVTFKAFRNSKSIKIIIKPFKGILVTYPLNVKIKKAERFLLQNKNQVLNTLNKMKEIECEESTRLGNLDTINFDEAANRIKERVAYLSNLNNLPYKRVSVREQKTRWGSCSHKNSINLNLSIISLPASLMDYVILHELVHTKVKNHSIDFWLLLEKYYPNCRSAAREIKSYKLPLIRSQ